MKLGELFKSRTVLAGLILGGQQVFAAVAPVAAQGLLGEKLQGIVQGLAIILGAVGVRSAISKQGTGK